jgi:nucleoside-diphosphate-sugar epimerase
MRLLLIGGTGFIGLPLLRMLVAAGHDVSVFHRGSRAVSLPSGVRSISGDRRRLAHYRAELAAFAPEVVIDAVLSSGRQAEELMATFTGVARRVVALSSLDVYRACGVLHGREEGPLEPVPLTEESPLRTRLRTYPMEQVRSLQAVYGWLDDDHDKIPVERAVLADARLPATVLRLPMVYGPGDPLRRLQAILDPIEDGRRFIVMAESTAQWRAPRGYVDDVAAAIALAAGSDRAAGRIYNVADLDFLTELQWAQRVASVAGWHGEIVVVPDDEVPEHLRPPGNVAQHWIADSSRIRRELAYAERVGVDEAIRRTIGWMRENRAPAADRRDYSAEDAVLARRPSRRDAAG